jgi:segregation and condensation protein B
LGQRLPSFGLVQHIKTSTHQHINPSILVFRIHFFYICIMEYLAQHVESLIFASDSPIELREIQECLESTFETGFEEEDLMKAIEQIKARYQPDEFAFELVEIAGGYQFMTKAAYHNTIGTYLKQTTRRRLSQAALETLAIIAYKQPVSKSDMERVRGVNCDYSIQKLLEKELVSIVGRSEGPGRPLLYGTSEKFMDYFGIKSLDDLPKPKDFKEPDSEIGEKAPIDEESEN